MPSRVYRLEFARRGIAPRVLSRTVEDAGTVTSPLVPWNSCGAYMAGVLGVPTMSYLPYCFFNLLSPLIALIYGFTGFRIERIPTERRAERSDAATPLPARSRRMSAGGGIEMTAAAPADRGRKNRHEPVKRGFHLPSAYTILFLLIVVVALATWIIPAGSVRLQRGRHARSRHVPLRAGRTRRASSSTR